MKKHSLSKKKQIVLYVLVVVLAFLAIFVEMAYESFHVEKVTDYMYSVECNSYSYDLAQMLLENNWVKLSAGACSTVKKGDIAGRNLDWLYDEEAEFIIRTQKTEDRYATLGLASVTGIQAKNVGRYSTLPMLSMLPFYTVDGSMKTGCSSASMRYRREMPV